MLLITAETYSKYLHPEDKSNISIFGDAATACVISSDKGIAQIGNFVLGSDGTGAENLIVKTGGARHRKATNKECCDDDGHIQRDDYLYMNGSAIFNFTLETVPPMVQQLLTLNNLAEDDIDLYVFHQANKFMLNTLRKCIGIPKDKFTSISQRPATPYLAPYQSPLPTFGLIKRQKGKYICSQDLA